jgi:phosphodiesterase/alkaline phosphatase D-like protein
VGGVRPERERLLRFLQANVKNVVFLTTDTHGNLVNEVRYKTFGTPEGSGMWEVVTGPVATNTFAKEIDGYLGQRAPGRRSAHSSSSPRRRTAWACAALRSTRTATPRSPSPQGA